MFATLKKSAIAGLVGIATLASVPAFADSLYLGFGNNDDPRFGVYMGQSSGHVRRPWEERRWEERRAWRESERRCSPDRALDKAERMGIRRARIDYVTGEEIGVIGRQFGDRVSVTFARSRGCPVIG